MAETAAASTLNLVHDGQSYRADTQTAELLRQVQHWQAGGDQALETALFEHGLKTGRIQPGPVAREQAGTAHGQPLTIEAPKALTAWFAPRGDGGMYDATPEAARKLWGIDRERHLYSEDEERSPGLYADEKRARHAAVDAKLEHAMAEELANGSLRLHVTRPFVLAEEAGDVVRPGGQEQVTSTQALDVPDRFETAGPAAGPSVQTPAAERRSWLDRVTDTTRDLLRRADQVVERWLPSPADTHFQQGAMIAFRDHATNTTRMAHVTEARHTRALDLSGWLPTQVVTIREEDPNGLTRLRALTPRELRSATLMQSTSSGQATDAPDRREIEARHEPVRLAADPPLRQPGSAWTTTVQQAWPGTTVRVPAPAEQRATIAWPVHQPRPLTFRATQARGLEQGQE